MNELEPADGPADLLDDVAELIAWLEAHPDAAVGEHVRVLLEHTDTIHRLALTHLVDGIRSMAGDAFLNRLTSDPAIRLLLMSYDLIAVDRRIRAEEALDAVRGHLHAHGIDIELDDVVGGVVWIRLHGLDRSGASREAVKRDIEAALREGLVGFQQLEMDGKGAPSSGLVMLEGMRRARRPVLFEAGRSSEIAPGSLRAVEIEGVPILLGNVDGVIHAVHNRCGESPLPLQYGSLDGGVLVCSWHGCRYDLRTGRRTDDGPERLTVYPVSVADDVLRIALSVQTGDDPSGERAAESDVDQASSLRRTP